MCANIKKGNKNKRDRKINSSGKYQVPPGWVVNDEGIFLLKYDRKGNEEQIPICYSPLKISGRGINVDTGEVFIQLSWELIMGEELKKFFPNKGKYRVFFPEKDLQNRNKLMEYLLGTVAFTDNTAKDLVAFISESVIYNLEFLENYTFSKKHGWEKEKNNINKKEGV